MLMLVCVLIYWEFFSPQESILDVTVALNLFLIVSHSFQGIGKFCIVDNESVKEEDLGNK